ncbi:MAG TPA: type VI secretion system contractile sheath large subunit [Pyrinomonadaceae bacterium]|nr:type VI secretion system contractile sheath large subunit [Pyrinomonadaceae bacterium]
MNEQEAQKQKEKRAAATALKDKPVINNLVRRDPDEDQYVNAADMVGELFYELKMSEDKKAISNTQVPDNEELLNWLEKHPEEIVGLLVHRIAQLDEEINEHLSNEVMHDPNFQTLEATWRGLHYLVSHTETGDKLKLRILDATKDEIRDDLAKAIEFDQSVQFKKIYEEEYGTFGGSPYSMLLADYFFEGTQPDLDFLERMSGVAAAAHAPFIAAAAPGLFDLERFADLNNPRDLTKIFGSTLFAKWKAFRDSEDSRYVALCLPRFLLRTPYGTDDYKKINKETGEYDKDDRTKEPKKESLVGRAPADEINFQERMSRNGDRDNPSDDKFLWGNAAYLMTERITNAFSHYKWTAAIRGVEGGGLVEGLPAINFQTHEGDVAFKCPVEVSITDRREKELSDLGFISLVHRKNTNQAAFFGGQTTQKPKLYMDPKATANARLSCSLPYILAASRFAHYIKVIMRDKVGSFQSRENVEKFLNSWISNYVLLNDDASQTSKASYPLREARVDVTDIPGKPGCYNATVYLRPHFQLEELTASIRLVAELPPPAAA